MKRRFYLFYFTLFFCFLSCKKEIKKSIVEKSKRTEKVQSPENFEGVYTYDSDNESQKMTVKITKKNGVYFYDLKTSMRKLAGKMTLDNVDGSLYLTIPELKWQLNVCEELDSEEIEESDNMKNGTPPNGIEFLCSDNEMTLQNGINSCRFVPFPECCEYYIHLIKQ